MLSPLTYALLRLLASFAHADEIQEVIFNAEAHRACRTLNAGGQPLPDRHFCIFYLSANAADEGIVRVLCNLEVAEPTAEIEFAHAALRNQHTQVAINRAEAQARKLLFDERLNSSRR